jgi:trans-aconitate 2-methyltransferase
MASDTWDPTQYERFKKERSQPFFDLLALVRQAPTMRAVDLGCGTGEWTRHLHVTLGAASTLGLDLSEAMLTKAAALAPAAGLSFTKGDIGAWAEKRPAAETYDLVFSNAALHWLPSHDALLRTVSAAVAPGGQLAVQVPANFDHPTHRVAAEVAAEMSVERNPAYALAPEAYATLLHRLGYLEQHVRVQVYPHVLPSRDDAVEWVKGTHLTEYEGRMSQGRFAEFLVRYRERLFAELPDDRPFFFPFKRILFWARRA